jgi:hypothetical protein
MISTSALGSLGRAQRPPERLKGCFGAPFRESAQTPFFQWGVRRGLQSCALNHRRRPGQNQPNFSPALEQALQNSGYTSSWEQQQPRQQPNQQQQRPLGAAAAGARAQAGGGGGGDGDGYASGYASPLSYAGTRSGGSPSQTLTLEEGPGSSKGSGRLGPPSAKQLLAQQLHAVETIEPSLGSLEDYNGFDTLEDGRADGSGAGSGMLAGKQAASVATFEVGGTLSGRMHGCRQLARLGA